GGAQGDVVTVHGTPPRRSELTAPAASPVPLLEIRNLRVQLPTRGGVVTAIDGIDLTIGRGEIVALVGESGSGKSMTALSIARLLPPMARVASGEIRLDGIDLLTLPDAEMNRVRGARIAMLFQQPKATLDPTSRVGDPLRARSQPAPGLGADHPAPRRRGDPGAATTGPGLRPPAVGRDGPAGD